MRTLKKRLVVVVMSLVLFITGIFAVGGIDRKKAEALSPNYTGGDTVYYFSDSTPILDEDQVRSIAGNLNVVYDIQLLISPQRLAYLVYTGYFWGFDYSNTVVIVEIKAMKPDPNTLRDLFECLQVQNCKVLFVSAFEYDDDWIFMDNVNEYLPCNVDKYGLFLDYSIIDMARQNVGYSLSAFKDWSLLWYNNDWGDIWADTCILLDGRFIGISNYSINTNYDAKYVLAYSTFLQRMILDMRYGTFNDERADFEFNMYRKLWQYYIDNYLEARGYDPDYSDVEIGRLIEIWAENGFDYEDFFYDNGEEYQEYYRDVIWNYFAEGEDEDVEGIFKTFVNRKIHILIHFPNSNVYWDIAYVKDDTEEFFHEFTNVEELYGELEVERLYAMGIWYLDANFYNFLLAAQEYLKNDEIRTISIYIWEVDPIEWGDGLEIITCEDLLSDYDVSEEYEEENLIDDLLGLIIQLIYG